MADINAGGGEEKRGKPKRLNLRVDFTPMVDMNMLLITFFMFCTTLSKPQMMNLVMPNKQDNEDITKNTKVDEDKTVTVLLGANNVVYYYFGKPNYADYTSLKETDYSPEGLRAMIVQRNGEVIRKIADLRKQLQLGQITDEEFKVKQKEIRDVKDGQVVVIKPTEYSTYMNLVDVLDEMQICSIGLYAITEVTEGDKLLMENLVQKGALSSKIEMGDK